MHVLLTSTDNPYITKIGGKHVHLLLLEQGLKKLKLDVDTLYYNKKSLAEIAKRSFLTVFPDKYACKFKFKWAMDYLRRHIPQKRFDVINAHDVLSLNATSTLPQKKVLTLHGYFARENIEFLKHESDRRTIYPYLLQMEREAMEKADYVITVDRRLKEYIISEFSFPQKKITILYNAVDTNTFGPVTEREQLELKKMLGFDVNHHVVLVPRRLVEKNGVIYAVQAMKYLENEKVNLIVAGEGPEKEKLVKEASNDQRVKFLGTIPHDKILHYYKMADIVLIPSITSHEIQEATSLAMLEGMACGKVVICSNIGGMREVILNGENGFLVPEKEPLEIARIIKAAIEGEYSMEKIGDKARGYVLEKHSFMSHTKKVATIYSDVIGGRSDS
jgi:glycosyltransferase involved in cell wall biosynthesis